MHVLMVDCLMQRNGLRDCLVTRRPSVGMEQLAGACADMTCAAGHRAAAVTHSWSCVQMHS